MCKKLINSSVLKVEFIFCVVIKKRKGILEFDWDLNMSASLRDHKGLVIKRSHRGAEMGSSVIFTTGF